ncbi:hypothetical protein FQN54_004191 [Arachnomyces sp. PD_36]|nr:hypothetical protein FQN54_004191 [Arachnomyces sp. PD_36]
MAPRNDPSKAIASVLAYSTRLRSILSDISSITSGNKYSSSLEELKHYIDILPLSPSSTANGGVLASNRGKLDTQGTTLWNACTRLMRRGREGSGEGDEGEKEENERARESEDVFLCYVKAFSFLLLESGCGDKRRADSDIRILKASLKAAKTCIGFKQLDIALKVLESAAIREENITKSKKDGHAGKDNIASKLSAEYYSLRVALAWRQDRLDLAEHMFSKIPSSWLERDPTTVENVADLFYEIGHSLLVGRQQLLATRWLKRSYDALSLHGLEAFSPDASELRLCVLHALVKVNVVLDGDKQMGMSLFEILQRDYGDKLPAMLLKLEVISKQLNPNYRDYSTCLLSMMRTAPFLYHIHKLKAWSLESAAEALQYLLVQRLSSHGNDDWVERSLVTLVWMMTAPQAADSGLDEIKTTIGRLEDSWRNQLSASATHAALILIWKKVDAAFANKEFAVAIEWCRLARCSIFENSGATNKAKIQRKLIMCGLRSSNTELARKAFQELPVASQSDPLTRFLMYKVALQDGDIDLGKECLEALCRLESDGTTYILACVVEAQQSNKRQQAAVALQRLLGKLDYSPADGIHLPALLRCTIRLLVIDQYPKDLGPEALSDITLRRMFCDFLSGVIAVAQARADDNSQSQQEHYLDVRIHVQSFRDRLKAQRARSDPEAGDDLVKKYRILLSFDFEAAVRLQQWDNLETLVYETIDFADERLYSVLVDVILCSEAPIEEMVTVFKVSIILRPTTSLLLTHPISQIIIKSISQSTKTSNTKLSRWIRCLFQLSLDSNLKVSEEVLDTAYALARDQQSSSSAYPEEELEWLSTTAFNKGVDFYLESADTESRRWVQMALDLARVMRDGGLLRVLKAKAEELEWDDYR